CTDGPFLYNSSGSTVERLHHIRLRNMPPLNVIQSPIVTFGNDRCQGVVGNADLRIAGDHPTHDSIGHSRHVQRICESDRILEEARFADAGKTGHLAGSVEYE